MSETFEFDLSDGYDPTLDFPLQSKPTDPEMRDSVSMWVSDSEGRFGFPRFCIESVGGYWEDRGVQGNIAFPDGRVLIGAGGYAPKPPKIVDGKVVTLNAGPLTFEVVEPLRRWVMTFDGPAYETTVQDQIRGPTSGPVKQVRIRLEAEMAVPPWTPGEDRARSGDKATASAFGAVGGHRHEQLFRCEGTFDIQGEPERPFKGTGLGIRRYGVRHVGGDFPGHCWQSAVFPSGKAFGLSGFPARADGTPAYCDAFIFENGKKTYAKMIEAPWMTRFVPHGGDVGFVLETEKGLVKIGGKTHDSTLVQVGGSMFGDWRSGHESSARSLPFHQCGVQYTWDGETTFGMIERSYPADKVSY